MEDDEDEDSSKAEIELCEGCEYLLHNLRTDMELPEEANEYFCSHNDLFTPGNDLPDAGEYSNFIGFLPVTPSFCPLHFWRDVNRFFHQRFEAPPMQYMILKWNSADLKWEVVFYCKDYKQYEEQLPKYPDDLGYVHMVDVKWLPGHKVYDDMRQMRLNIAAKVRAAQIAKIEGTQAAGGT